MAFKMGDEEKRIKIVIEGADAGASNVLKEVGSGLSGILSIATGIVTSQVITKAFDSIVSGVTGLFIAAVEEENIMTLLNQGVEHLGSAAAMTSPQMVELAERLGQTTKFSHDLYLEGENLLMRFTMIGTETFPRVVQSAADLATVTGMDLPNTMRLLGRALEDPIAGMASLRRYNVVLTEAQKEQIKTLSEQGNLMAAQAVILDAVDKAFGGAAEAMGGTFSGQQAILKNNLESLSELLGGALLPMMNGLNKALTTITSDPKIMSFFADLGIQIGTALEPLAKLTDTFLTGFASGGLSGGLTALFGPMQEKISSFASILSGGELATGLANLKSFFGGDWSASMAASQETLGKLVEYCKFLFETISMFVTSKVVPFLVEQFTKVTAWLNDNQPLIDRFIVVLNNMYQAFLTGLEWLAPKLLGLWSVIGPFLAGMIDWLLKLGKIVMQVFTSDWAGAWETAKLAAIGAGQTIWNAVVALLEWIAGLFGSSLKGIGDTWAGVWEAMKTTVSLVLSIVVTFFMGIWASIVSIWTGIVAFFQGAWNSISTTVSTVILVISGALFMFWDWILGLFGTSITALKTQWLAGWATIFTLASTAWNTIVTFYAGAWATFSGFWTGVWNSLVSIVSTIGGKLVTTGSTVVTNLWTSIKGVWTSISTWWTGVWNLAVAVVTGIGGSLYSTGSSIVQGLWNGLKNAWSSVEAWWTNTVQAFINKAKSILGIRSPSSEFEIIGNQIVNGLVGGIGQNIKVPVNMIGDLGKNMVGAMGGVSNSNTANSMTFNISGSDPRAVVDEIMRVFKLQGIKFETGT
jgi:phage-related protein